MALESVNYAEDRAKQILQIVQEEEDTQHSKTLNATGYNTLAVNVETEHEVVDGNQRSYSQYSGSTLPYDG